MGPDTTMPFPCQNAPVARAGTDHERWENSRTSFLPCASVKNSLVGMVQVTLLTGDPPGRLRFSLAADAARQYGNTVLSLGFWH